MLRPYRTRIALALLFLLLSAASTLVLPLALKSLIDSGLVAHLVCVDPRRIDRRFAGRRYDAELLADFPDTVDPCGENGEFHTCVVAGPMFSRRLAVTTGERVERDGYAYCDLVMG